MTWGAVSPPPSQQGPHPVVDGVHYKSQQAWNRGGQHSLLGSGDPLKSPPGLGRAPPGTPTPSLLCPLLASSRNTDSGAPHRVREVTGRSFVFSPKTIAGITSAVILFVAVVATTICCFLCSCCYLYRRRQQLQSPFEGRLCSADTGITRRSPA